MGTNMRRLLTFLCESEICAATLDDAGGTIGVLIVTGGREPRIGAHRWQALLAGALAASGFPTLRFDRRGVGDSAGEDHGFADCGRDITAAAVCLRHEASAAKRLIGIGNCDAATALALHHRDAGLAAVILLNPWLGGSDEDGLPAAAAIRQRYRERLINPRAWLRLITGKISCRAALRGLRKAAATEGLPVMARQIAESLGDLPAQIVVSAGDATGIGFASAWRSLGRVGRNLAPVTILQTRSHSFAAEGDHDRLVAVCLDAIYMVERG